LEDPAYFQWPVIELPFEVLCDLTQTKLGPGFGDFAWLYETKRNGRIIIQVMGNRLNRLYIASSFPKRNMLGI
jgi:hypothetical protein